MTHLHEDPNQQPQSAELQPMPIGELAVHGLQHEDDGSSYINGHQLDEVQEDPLEGDVDRFVHTDETRTDEQMEFDRRHAIEPYGHDAAEDYGAEMDEYLGVNDFAEEPAEPALMIEPHKGYPDGSQINVETVKRTYQKNAANLQKMRDEGMSDEQIAEKLDADHDETWKRIRERNRKTAMQMEDDDYDGEDPLAGDVDR